MFRELIPQTLIGIIDASWTPKAALGERSWLNPHAAWKRGVGILPANEYARLVTVHGIFL